MREVAALGQSVESPVSRAGRDEGDGRCAAVEREVDRATSPVQGFLLRYPGQTDEDEDAQRNARLLQEGRGPLEVREGHALVQSGKNLRVDRLEAERNLQPAIEQVAKAQAEFAHEGRMRLDDHPFEGPNEGGDLLMLFGANRLCVEEAARVVQLDVPRPRQGRERPADLRGDRSRRRRLRKCVLPQVAHQAPPGALAVSQEDRGDGHDLAVLCGLLLDERRVGARWVEVIALRALLEDPTVPFPVRRRIGEAQGTVTRHAYRERKCVR